MIDDKLSEQIIGAAFQVYNTLGFGFLESVYEKALSVELKQLRIEHETQTSICVFYRDHAVGHFVADLRCGDDLIVELKSTKALSKVHEVQLVNYLVATKIDHGLLLNFGPDRVEVKRKFRHSRRS